MTNLKTKEEIKIMKEGGGILAKILRRLKEEVKPGINTFQLEKLARELVLSYGVEPSFLGYDGYPAVLCTSVNEEIVHGVPSEKKVLNNGDVLKLDMGICFNGFHTDSAVTVIVENDNDMKKKELLRVTHEALEIGIRQAKPGNTTGDIGAAIQEYVKKNGFEIQEKLSVSNFRSPLMKKIIPEAILLALEDILQKPLSCFNFGNKCCGYPVLFFFRD